MWIERLHDGTRGACDPPSVTFWIQCHAHERFVAESVRSAIAQTLPSMDVVISDDASPDDTVRVVRDVVRAQPGAHRVTLIRSRENRGIFEHASEVVPHLRGRFIVWQSGDDVAEPDRAAALLEAAGARGACGAFSNHRMIDDEGLRIGVHFAAGDSPTLDLSDYASGRFLDFSYGGTIGFSREVFDSFGPLPGEFGGRGLEHCLGLRMALLGGSVYVPRLLVSRRRHAHSVTEGISAADREDDPLAVHERRVAVRRMILAMLRSHLVGPDGALRRTALASRGGRAGSSGGWIERCRERTRVLRRRRDRRELATLAHALARQLAVETERLTELRAFRERRARAGVQGAGAFLHAGLRFDPPALEFVRELPGARNLLAFEGMFFAVPQSCGPIEPCRLRNHEVPGAICAFTEDELERRLEALPATTVRTHAGLRSLRRRASRLRQ